MDDCGALDFLKDKLGSDAETARQLSVRAQVLWNWRDRSKISADKRPAVWALVNDHGGELSREWLVERPATQQGEAA